jgi:cytochrome P450
MAPVSPHAFWRQVDQPSSLPGPPRLPFVGSAFLLGKPSQFYSVMQKWLKKYGDLFYVKIGADGYVVSTNMALSRLLFENRPDGVERPPMIARSFESIDLLENLFAAEGENWRKQRKAIAKSLSAHNLGKAEEMIGHEVQRRLDRMDREIESRPGQPVNFLPHAKQYSLGIIIRLVFGDDFRQTAVNDDLSAELSVLFNTLARRTVAPLQYWKFLRLPADRAFETVKNRLRKDISTRAAIALENLRNKPKDHRPDNLLDGLLLHQLTEEPQQSLSDNEVFSNAVALIAAGMDTTSTTLAWALYLLGTHTDVQRKLRSELMTATDGTGLLPSLQGVHAQPLLEAVIWEALRLYPAAPFLIAHTTREFEFEGQRIPADTSFFFMHDQAEKVANSNAGFNPQRWLDSGELAKAVKMLPLPFGIGQRLCPGRNLSLMELKAYLAAVVCRYEWTTPGTKEPGRVYNFTLEPESMPLVFKRL